MNHFQEPNSTDKLADANRRKWFIAARKDKERKTQIEEQSEEALLDFAVAVIVATEIEIQTFQSKLDTYDEATVIALMENQELLDAVNERIADMLSRAYILEDGRRVFKTEDGKRVFDEHGEQIDEAIIHPDVIADDKPTWEAFSKSQDERATLLQEREGLIEYQEKLDDARESSNADSFTKEELDELEAELEADMPQAIAKHISGMEAVTAVGLKTEFKTPGSPVNETTPVVSSPLLPTPQNQL